MSEKHSSIRAVYGEYGRDCMKILFTSVGRRVELMQAFRSAAQRIGEELEIYGADITDSAPALYFCDKTVLVPRIRDESYIPVLADICRKENIDALIPTIDTDLLLLAENRESFGGTKVIISAPDKVRLCRDKRLTADYFNSVGLKSPKPVDDIRKYDGLQLIPVKNISEAIAAVLPRER